MRPANVALETDSHTIKPLRIVSDEVCQKPKTFSYYFDTSLKHSNATQNVYFSNFFDWQGAVRERWFYECISPDMLAPLGVFITKKAHNEYLKEAFPFQTIRCDLNTFNIQRCSFYLRFLFYSSEANKKDVLIAHGFQQIVFARHDKKITRLGDDILRKIRLYEKDCDLDSVA